MVEDLVRQTRSFLLMVACTGRNLLPMVAVVAAFQLFVAGGLPEGVATIALGLVVVAVGLALFVRGLDLGIFPAGRSLANEFARRGSLGLLLTFGFSLGFAASVAEPSLLAVARKAEIVSDGTIDATILRLLVATSVGLAVTVGLLRALWNHPIHYYLAGGYLLLLAITWLTPPEITGLAFDTGAVSANMVTVPLLVALGLGLTGSLRGRGSLIDGFGLAALVVLVPRIVVQIYGLAVYRAAPEAVAALADGPPVAPPPPGGVAATLLADLAAIVATIAPIVGVILFFQFVVLRRALPNWRRLGGALLLLICGLFLFIEGLFLGLFPIGEQMARELGQVDGITVILLFVFLLGLSATLVEPALIVVTGRAADHDPGRINALAVRLVVACGVGIGLALGVARLAFPFPLELLLAAVVVAMLLLVAIAPRDLVAFSADLGGIATSDVTVPVITTLGVGLAAAFGSKDVMVDGFGLVALASLAPIVAVLLYAMVADRMKRQPESLS